ncbi:MAG TPA: hypothetical protein VFX65_07780 [Candidatus Limnocylindrales bacterium]|nr:hypothetical protein [Candidatus Limnocylindrales bacterium]
MARRSTHTLVACLVAAAVAACGWDGASPSPPPTERPTDAPAATPSMGPGGPLEAIGPVGRGTYETPEGFEPWFSFVLRADDWRTIVVDELGFNLVTPNAARMEALIGAARPVAATLDDFDAELAAAGLLDGTAIVEELAVDGVPARSYSVELDEATDGFRMTTTGGEVVTSFGGPLPQNRFVYVAHPDGAVVLVFAGTGEDAEPRFAFDQLVASIDFR